MEERNICTQVYLCVVKKNNKLITFECVSVPTCPPGVLIIWLGFNVGFEFFLLVAHIHPPVPHYLLLGASQTDRCDKTRVVKTMNRPKPEEGGKVKEGERW